MTEIEILVVEDHPAVSATLSRYLQRLGHSVARVTDLAGAREHLCAHQYDLVLADLESADGDSRTLADMLPEHCYFVTMSGYDEAPARQPHERWLGHLRKPYLLEDLVGLLDRTESALAAQN